MSRASFEDVKIGDKLIVKASRYGDPEYTRVVVTKMTTTRFMVSPENSDGQVLTFTKKDGDQYPRPSGYGLRYYIERPTGEHAEFIEKQIIAQKIRRLAYDLNDMFGRSSFRDKIQKGTTEELLTNLSYLQTVYKQFKNYGEKSDG